MQMCKAAKRSLRKASLVERLAWCWHWNPMQTAIAPFARFQPPHLSVNSVRSTNGWCLTDRSEMPSLFLGQTGFHAVITGESRAADSIVWSDTLKRSLILRLNGCHANYNTPFVSTEEPSRLTYCSFPIQSVWRGWQQETWHWRATVLSHRAGQRHAGGSLLSYAARPLPFVKLRCWEIGHGEGWGQNSLT